MLTKKYLMSFCGDCIRPEGRVTINGNGLLMDWSACGFTVNFNGCAVNLHFGSYRADQPVIVLAVLDGVRSKYSISDGNETVTVECADIKGNRSESHTLTLLRLSEGGVPLYCRQLDVISRYDGVSPELAARPAEKKRRIVFFGDSITCGYGNLGVEGEPGFRTWEEDPTLAYAYLTAEELGAAAEIVSISGQGIVRNCNGDVDTPIPLFFRWQSRTLRTEHDFARQPDAVVVNAGTNDWGGAVTDEEFDAGAEAFLRDLRKCYPSAPVVWFYGLMGDRYDAVLRNVTEKLNAEIGGIYYLPADIIIGHAGNFGANGHPSFEGAQRGALILGTKLCEILHW